MISELHADNFKSLTDFTMPMSKFTVLVGMNGAGKTTILQAFDFATQMMKGNIDEWLANRGWAASDLTSKLRQERNISLRIRFSDQNGVRTNHQSWAGVFNIKRLACSREFAEYSLVPEVRSATKYPKNLFEVSADAYKIGDADRTKINFTYQGSILSQLRDKELPPSLRDIRDRLRKIRSLELLSPHLMRQKARGASDDVGFGGEKLSAFLSSIKGEQKTALVQLLKQFYPHLVAIKASAIKGGWKRLAIVEDFNGKHIETEARHINDGLLRILAILAQNQTSRSLLIFDEIENGVNPELVEKLVNLLVKSEQQIIVTTHSPMILNYLDDETAREAVQFVYKSPKGDTRVRRFFDIPRISQKLAVMGPGEAFVDTDLEALVQECLTLDEAAAAVAAVAALASAAEP